jgi:large subunit ribosomal protein L2
MGKRIIQQRRGRGTLTYRSRKKAFRIKISYPQKEGEAEILKLLNSPGHTAPIAKIKIGKKIFYNVAGDGLIEGQKISIGGNVINTGNILKLKDIPIGTPIFNVETFEGSGGKLVRASGLNAKISKKVPKGIIIGLPSKKEKLINENARATIGIVAGSGRLEKPFLKAGKRWHMMKARGKLYPRTSAVKMNVIDHPFGSGRGKRIKSKIPKRNAPPGKKVGLLYPRRTGRKKK